MKLIKNWTIRSVLDCWFYRCLSGYIIITLFLSKAYADLALPKGYESDLNEGIETINKAAEVFKTILTGTIAALIVISFIFAILLRAVPSREWKEKGKELLFDNFGTILLILIGLPALLSVLKLIKL